MSSNTVVLASMFSVSKYVLKQEGVYDFPVPYTKLDDICVSIPQNIEEDVPESEMGGGRVKQLSRNRGTMTQGEKFLAEIIESVYARVLSLPNCYPMFLQHKKDSFFKCSIFIDPPSQAFHLYFGKKQAKIDSGSFKHVLRSRAIPFSCEKPVFSTAWKINQLKVPLEGKMVLANPIEEAQLSLRYKSVPKVYFAVILPSKKGIKATRVDTVEELCSPLFSAVEKQLLTEDQILKVAKDLFVGLLEFHRDGLAHMDLDLTNALFKKKQLGDEIEPVWTDLGMAVRPQHEFQKDSPLMLGMYGRFNMTPPEGFSGCFFKGDIFKLDSWAFGICLYELLFCRAPSWVPLLHDFNEKNMRETGAPVVVLPCELREEFMSFLDKEISFIKGNYEAEKNGLRKVFLEICCKLLEKEPKVRWSLQQVVDRLEKGVEPPYPISVSVSKSAPLMIERRNGIVRGGSC